MPGDAGHGGEFALLTRMRARDTLNSRPGSVPDVWSRGNDITCRLDIATTQGNAYLLLKSDATGNLRASIEHPHPRVRDRRGE